jgi:biopolymer transport protein ExbB/TolQ
MNSKTNTTNADNFFVPDTANTPSRLKWRKSDFEQKLGFAGGRFTDTNFTLPLLATLVLTGAVFAFCFYAPPLLGGGQTLLGEIADKFTKRGVTPYPIAFFTLWGLVILQMKRGKLRFQEKALFLAAVPQEPDFTLTPKTAQNVLAHLENLVDDCRHFLLFNRIHVALSNLRNLGQVSDVTSILRTQSTLDEDQVSSSYTLVNGFIWAVPVLGFLGTVLGLATSMGAFGVTLQAGGDMSKIREALTVVTGGLSTAFDTTLLGLVGTLILQLRATLLRRDEMRFLDDCNEYCQTNVVAKLRLITE